MTFDTFIIGQVCQDINTDFDGKVYHMPGGAALYAGNAAAAIGHKVAVLAKGTGANHAEAFGTRPNITVFPLPYARDTEMSNTFFTADRERRDCRCMGMIESYKPAELPDVQTKLYHIAGLVQGDIDEDMIEICAERADTAVDVQCLLRRRERDGRLVFRDWAEKRRLLPLIRYLKTDAAEAEVLTGEQNRVAAAKILHGWGARELMITHNSEVLVYDGVTVYTEPLRPRNLSGRTGRGDSCFSAYITERHTKDIPTALRFAAALVSLKMETPGPFRGTRCDVEDYMELHYKDGNAK
ncbi:MAG: PfkB family carbohydrate kinase [Clostridiales bacterium]|nr:PfkB family carbohydrate kinase [Clostridiales bacterium]